MPVSSAIKPRERRNPRKTRRSIVQILEIMQDHADTNYNGNLTDNAIEIYPLLEEDDQRTFLRKGLEALWERQISYAQEGLQEVVLHSDQTSEQGISRKEVRINPVEVRSEREHINSTTPEEQKKLRQWILRVLLVVMFVMFIAIIGFTALYGEHDAKTIFEAAKNINTLIELLLKAE